MFSLFWSSELLEISHACGKLCAGLDFVFSRCKPTKWSQSSGWLWPQSSPKVTISIYVIWWKLLFHSTILFSSFPRLYKAELTRIPRWYNDAIKNFRGVAWLWSFTRTDRIIIKKKKKRWLKLMCWYFCYLADKRTDKYDYHQMRLISTNLRATHSPWKFKSHHLYHQRVRSA